MTANNGHILWQPFYGFLGDFVSTHTLLCTHTQKGDRINNSIVTTRYYNYIKIEMTDRQII